MQCLQGRLFPLTETIFSEPHHRHLLQNATFLFPSFFSPRLHSEHDCEAARVTNLPALMAPLECFIGAQIG